MSIDLLNYITGEEIQIGDRVQYRGTYGTIVFLSNGDQEEFMPGYESYAGTDSGVVVCDDDGETTHLSFPDEMLTFIDRG